MADTLEPSLRSIVEQVPADEYEIIVVDGGSTDGSRDILHSLEQEYSNLRAVLNRAEECDDLGGDRNISFEESRGDYILESMDTDDHYFEGIVEDFVSIFHQLENNANSPFFLSGTGINMAPRDLLLDIPYYDLGGAEDRDFWRRLFANDALVWLEHGPVSEEIGYHMDLRDQVRRDIHGKVCDFQSGITLRSALKWSLSHKRYWILERDRGPLQNTLKKGYDFISHLHSYLKARGREKHAAPPGFEKKGRLEQRIAGERATLHELANKYSVEIDCSEFSENGRRAFCSNS